ncbi:glycine cleavage system protein R [Microbacterium oleivorans]|uniref:Amino acid-binding ACT protein n=1 Tax=Microbacterium oleivorans TaxID=273677 RepID=A0A7D5EY65_9MICO|nr:ACT domain-containing protein [Microbacterium oleivorans]QLD13011.1 amino acid-binding ACT protein [Microbacterium oleivorans]
MTQLVLTVVGDDRVGLVRTLADTVAAHGGNWERSELAELAGAFAGIVLVDVPEESRDVLVAALERLDGLLRITTHQPLPPETATGQVLRFTVLGNDRPGIVREVSDAIGAHALSIDGLTSRTLDAPMAGGTLFEATLVVRLPAGFDTEEVIADLERLAGEIQVDLTLV